jgi:hypothetical protein
MSLPTAFQPPSNRLPTMCPHTPPIPPYGWDRPNGRFGGRPPVHNRKENPQRKEPDWDTNHPFGAHESLKGRAVRSLGPEHAGIGTHQAYDRTARREFVNAFGPGFRQ